MMQFSVGTSGQRLVITRPVLSRFRENRQIWPWQREAGGLLFARFEKARVTVEAASGPRPGDRRSRTSYVPDKRAQQEEIDRFHRSGLFFVGTWHTHPSPVPLPSRVDVDETCEAFRLSRHALNGFVLVIVGNSRDHLNLYVGVCDGSGAYQLAPETDPPPRRFRDCLRTMRSHAP